MTILKFFLFLVVISSRICHLTSTLRFSRSLKIELSLSEIEYMKNSQLNTV